MKQISFLFLFTILSIASVKSQSITFGTTGNLGISKVTSQFVEANSFQMPYAFSGNGGFFLEKKINQKSYIGVEALWVQIEGNRVANDKPLIETDASGEIEVVGNKSERFTKHISYLGLPFYYRYEIGNFGVKGGLQTMLFLFANSDYKSEGIRNNNAFEEMSSQDNISLRTIDLGPKIGIDYKLTNKLKLRADYYLGILVISTLETPSSTASDRNNRQFTLGVSYAFSKNKFSRN